MNTAIDWLLEDDNPAVQYRTKTELLSLEADKKRVIDWVNKFLPPDWEDKKGLWYTYYLTAIAECGLTYGDIQFDKDKALTFEKLFEFGCGDFMRLRALVMLGLHNEPQIIELLRFLKEKQLPDGGFLCLHRLDKLRHIPKSCVKSNNIALMLCSECKKRGIDVEITDNLLSYFWNHNLFYRTSDPSRLMLDAREGWRMIDIFYPFEVMRVGLQNIIESLCTLGYANDSRLKDAWDILKSKKGEDGRILLDGTMTKPYMPKERVKKPSKWATFYTLLAEQKAAE